MLLLIRRTFLGESILAWQGKNQTKYNYLIYAGRNSKKQACIYRMCAWKNPSGKRIKPGTAPVAAKPIAPDATTSPAAVRYVDELSD